VTILSKFAVELAFAERWRDEKKEEDVEKRERVAECGSIGWKEEGEEDPIVGEEEGDDPVEDEEEGISSGINNTKASLYSSPGLAMPV